MVTNIRSLYFLALKAMIKGVENNKINYENVELPPTLAEEIWKGMKFKDQVLLATNGKLLPCFAKCIDEKPTKFTVNFSGNSGTCCVIRLNFQDADPISWSILESLFSTEQNNYKWRSLKIGGLSLKTSVTSRHLFTCAPDCKQIIPAAINWLIELFQPRPEDTFIIYDCTKLNAFSKLPLFKTSNGMQLRKCSGSNNLESVIIQRHANNLKTTTCRVSFEKPVKLTLSELRSIDFNETFLDFTSSDLRSIIAFCSGFLKKPITQLPLIPLKHLVNFRTPDWTPKDLFNFKTMLKLDDYTYKLVNTHVPHFRTVPEDWHSYYKLFYLNREDESAIVFVFTTSSQFSLRRAWTTLFNCQTYVYYNDVSIYRWKVNQL